jgi:hypothetical protein
MKLLTLSYEHQLQSHFQRLQLFDRVLSRPLEAKDLQTWRNISKGLILKLLEISFALYTGTVSSKLTKKTFFLYPFSFSLV